MRNRSSIENLDTGIGVDTASVDIISNVDASSESVGYQQESDAVVLAADVIPVKNPAAVALGRLGGLKGGRARASRLSADRRSEIASAAASARWKNKA